MFEGKPGLEPHWDRIGKVWDVCYGDTIAEKRSYTEEECRDLLASRLAEFAEPVLERNPELKGRDPQLLAATSLAYNIGLGPADLRRCGKAGVQSGYRCSTVAKRFSAGNWRGACDAFLMWTKAGGREIKGLRIRREKERAICLRGL
jgi:lysozyme